MRVHFVHCIAVAFACVLASALVPFSAATLRGAEAPSGNPSDVAATPQQLVQAALAAEAQGQGAERDQLLAHVLERYPDHAPARWHSGYVRLESRWLKIDEAAAQTRAAGKVAAYRQLRDQLRDNATAADHLRMAQWCEGAGLPSEERVHLIYAMQSGPTKAEAQRIAKKLNLVPYQGILLPAAQVESLATEAKRAELALQTWKPRLAELQRGLQSHSHERRAAVTAELHAMEHDPAATPALESLLLKSTPANAQVVIDALAAMPDQAATDVLVRYALNVKSEASSKYAAKALKSRSVYGYVPTLMNALEPLVHVQFENGAGVDGSWHQLTIYQEGPEVNRVFRSSGSTILDGVLITHRVSQRPSSYYATSRPDPTVESDLQRAHQELLANPKRQRINERVASVLRNATDNDLGSAPNDWWSWWLDYNEMYRPTAKPVNEVAVASPRFTMRTYNVSCFPAGTPVQTSTGPLAIDQIRPGDNVLAQDPDTGELAYKPVLATTVRPVSPLIQIRTSRETIHATRGHPFWVCGLGWQMAKELKAGQWLHTTSGPVQVEIARSHGEDACYNLVVADFNTFFVGEGQILVHDNNLRQVTTALVPGLQPAELSSP